MALHVFMCVLLLMVCLLLSLVLLRPLDWFPLRPSSSQGEAKRSTLHRLLKPRSPTIAPPVVSPPLPHWGQGQQLLLYAPGARSKAGGEHRSEYTPRASLVPTSSACTSGSPMPTFMPWLAMASMAVPNGSRPFAARRAISRSLPGATRPCTV